MAGAALLAAGAALLAGGAVLARATAGVFPSYDLLTGSSGGRFAVELGGVTVQGRIVFVPVGGIDEQTALAASGRRSKIGRAGLGHVVIVIFTWLELVE